ncbi:MAG: type II 3-dehydroquinate dehydratase [Bacillota bacterium]|nr:type II 3-dehydroquinate dehydratase [Bacillota bacterium]
MKFYIIHGPNINLLGRREPNIYGRDTYAGLIEYITEICEKNHIEPEFFQSNHEGDLVDYIQDALGKARAIIINPAAYTHTSIAILDAVKAVALPTVEVHLSNIYEREEFRHRSYISLAAVRSIYGKGFEGYKEAVEFLADYLKN